MLFSPVLHSILKWHRPLLYVDRRTIAVQITSAYAWSETPTPYLPPFLFAEAASMFDLQLSYTACRFKRLRKELDAGRPVVALVHYGSLPQRQNQRFTGAQYIIVVGYDKGKFIIHDSNWYNSKAGCLMEITSQQLFDAYGPVGAYNISEPPYQCFLLPERKKQSRNRTCAPPGCRIEAPIAPRHRTVIPSRKVSHVPTQVHRHPPRHSHDRRARQTREAPESHAPRLPARPPRLRRCRH